MLEKGLAPVNILSKSENLRFFEDPGIHWGNTVVSQETKNSTELDVYMASDYFEFLMTVNQGTEQELLYYQKLLITKKYLGGCHKIGVERRMCRVQGFPQEISWCFRATTHHINSGWAISSALAGRGQGQGS